MINPVGSTAYVGYARPLQEAPGPRQDAVRLDGSAGLSRSESSGGSDRAKAAAGAGGCKTCKSRKYQDVSNDPGVSFKSATTVAPEAAAAAVASHEREHVSRERTKAGNEGRKVVYQSVRYSSACCPECGKTYISGGETTTATRAKAPQSQPGVGEAVDAYG
jgi:hypothetical protein